MMPIVRPRSEEDLWSSKNDLSPPVDLSTILKNMPSTISYPGSLPTSACDENCQSSRISQLLGAKTSSSTAPAKGLPSADSAFPIAGASTFVTLTSSGATATGIESTSASPQSNGGHSSGDYSASTSNHSSGPSTGKILVATILPLIAITAIGLAIWMMMRRRHQRRRMAQLAEMKMHPGDEVAEHRGEPPQYRSSATSSEHLTTSSSNSTPSPPAPVIISSVAPTGNAAYFSGIDTSEAFSVRSNSVRSHNRPAGFVLDGEFHEEPPPPYKPCSVPPLSREASIHSRTYSEHDGFLPITTVGQQHASIRNPFADPVDEDDQYSEVSDLSYTRNDRSERTDGRPLVRSAV